jgi:ATP-grasp domain
MRRGSNDFRTFLVLYPDGATHRVLVNAAENLRRRGVNLVIADREFPLDGRASYPRVALPPYQHVGKILRVLRKYCAQNRIDEVVAQSEAGLLPGALLIHELGLRGISLQSALLCTNKLLSRKMLKRAGIPVPRFARVENLDQACRFGRETGYPVVLKAVASTMGRNVTRVESESELPGCVERIRREIQTAPDIARCQEFADLAGLDMDCDPSRQFLIEEFIDGIALETDGFVYDDRIELFGVIEQIVSQPPYFYIEGYLFPADTVSHEAGRISTSALRATGLTNSGFSMELRARDGATYVIEINGRLAEDFGLPELFHAGLGYSPIIRWLEYLIGDEPQNRRALRHAALAYINWYKGGRVKTIPSSKNVLPAIEILVHRGSKLYPPHHVKIIPQLAYALATHPTSSRLAYCDALQALSTLKFDIE